MTKVVVALGGNALGVTPADQLAKIKKVAQAVVPLVAKGRRVVLCHGNGPQVGMIHQAFEDAHLQGELPYMPLAECTAMSQGYIGYHLQQALGNELRQIGAKQTVVTLATQVVVDATDTAFTHPDKPIGGYFSQAEAMRLMEETEDVYMEDAGRGWRLAVPSPRPIDILEHRAVADLTDTGSVVIACGGGGVPVVRSKNDYTAVQAVVDKDFAAARLAELIGADRLVILTAVERVSLHFGTPQQREISHMTVSEAQDYAREGHFSPGSMLPKIEACWQFAAGKKERIAVIGALEHAADALEGRGGTHIV